MNRITNSIARGILKFDLKLSTLDAPLTYLWNFMSISNIDWAHGVLINRIRQQKMLKMMAPAVLLAFQYSFPLSFPSILAIV
jgi:hypothetical protein